jgi:integrase
LESQQAPKQAAPRRSRKRRGRGEGSIHQRRDGTWCASLTIGFDENGKQRRRSVYGPTKAKALEGLQNLQRETLNGDATESRRLTVAAYLKQWLDDSARPNLRTSSFRSYSTVVRLHINPVLGHIQLAKLRPMHVQALHAETERKGASPRLRQLVHAVLRRALNQAVRWNLIAQNPCGAVGQPRVARKPFSVLDPSQVVRLLEAAADDRLEALYVLAIATGMRQGEMLGLCWTDVDLAGRTVSVSRTHSEVGSLELNETKTDAGRRLITLPDFAIAALKRHRECMFAEGHLTAPPLTIAGRTLPGPLVFCAPEGGPIFKHNLLARSFRPLLAKAKLPAIRFHDLRHTAATLLLTANEHPKVAQERLGHAKVSTTFDIYSHVLPSLQRNAAAKLDDMLTTARSANQSGPNSRS